jgi:hypothetical protein
MTLAGLSSRVRTLPPSAGLGGRLSKASHLLSLSKQRFLLFPQQTI